MTPNLLSISLQEVRMSRSQPHDMPSEQRDIFFARIWRCASVACSREQLKIDRLPVFRSNAMHAKLLANLGLPVPLKVVRCTFL
jgi:hypothetical protein